MEQIINGVDVMLCIHYASREYLTTNNGYEEIPDYCSNFLNHICSQNPNCYYKQLQQLKQENEELKREVHLMMDCPECRVDEYEQKLEKIKEQVVKCNNCSNNECGTCVNLSDYILQIIEEQE